MSLEFTTQLFWSLLFIVVWIALLVIPAWFIERGKVDDDSDYR